VSRSGIPKSAPQSFKLIAGLSSGGLNPCLITESADAKLAGTRTAWGKCHNSGQICIAPDYVLVHPSVETEFVGAYIQALNRFFPEGAAKSPDLSRIINNRHFHRIKGLLENSKGTVLYGGEMDESRCFIAPTLVKVTDLEDSLLSEEIFGPVLPMLVVEDLDKMIALARKIGECPLGLYIFSNVKKDQEKGKVEGLRFVGKLCLTRSCSSDAPEVWWIYDKRVSLTILVV
jgi:beta-apo-4'-carotenal oxygenase